MKRILVLGAGGFIGSHLVTRLKQEGHWVCGVDLKYPEFSVSPADQFILTDLTKSDSFDKLPNIRFDEIYQLAADMGGADYVFVGTNDGNIMRNSISININTINYCIAHDVGRIFYSSSACVYPAHNQTDPSNPICSEDSAYPANPDSEYGWEKLFSERLYLAHAKSNNLIVRIARYHNVYGPNGTWTGGKEKSPAALCRKVAESSNGIIEIYGNGVQTRSFLYISDCIDATILLMRSQCSEPINVGSEEMVTINYLVDIIAKIANKTIIKKHINGPVGVMGRCSDNSIIKNQLNWEPSISLREGITFLYTWVKQHVIY